MDATHKISACYFPGDGTVELTWERIDSGESVTLTTAVPKEIGEQLAKVVNPCVYYGAVTPWFQEEEILRKIVEIFDPDCPDVEAYIEGHIDVVELIKRRLGY